MMHTSYKVDTEKQKLRTAALLKYGHRPDSEGAVYLLRCLGILDDFDWNDPKVVRAVAELSPLMTAMAAQKTSAQPTTPKAKPTAGSTLAEELKTAMMLFYEVSKAAKERCSGGHWKGSQDAEKRI